MALARSFAGTLFVASVANLKAARPLALGDDLAARTFDLAKITTGSIDLLRDQRRARQTSASFALRKVAASVDSDFCQGGTEVELKHGRNGLKPLIASTKHLKR